MIKSIQVTNHLGESLTMELGPTDSSGLLIQSVEGLDPVSSDINISDRVIDGGVYNSARRGNRNVVLTMKLTYSPTIEECRHKAYKYFPVKKKVKLTITTDIRTMYIEGYVESNSPNIFSNFSTVQVSILCPDPYLRDNTGVSETLDGYTKNLEFPFSNESTSEATIEMSSINQGLSINYVGDIESAININIAFNAEWEGFTISNSTYNESLTLDGTKLNTILGRNPTIGDTIVISGEPGNKQIYLMDPGGNINLLNALTDASVWLNLYPGINNITVTSDNTVYDAVIDLTSDIIYEGV